MFELENEVHISVVLHIYSSILELDIVSSKLKTWVVEHWYTQQLKQREMDTWNSNSSSML